MAAGPTPTANGNDPGSSLRALGYGLVVLAAAAIAGVIGAALGAAHIGLADLVGIVLAAALPSLACVALLESVRREVRALREPATPTSPSADGAAAELRRLEEAAEGARALHETFRRDMERMQAALHAAPQLEPAPSHAWRDSLSLFAETGIDLDRVLPAPILALVSKAPSAPTRRRAVREAAGAAVRALAEHLRRSPDARARAEAFRAALMRELAVAPDDPADPRAVRALLLIEAASIADLEAERLEQRRPRPQAGVPQRGVSQVGGQDGRRPMRLHHRFESVEPSVIR